MYHELQNEMAHTRHNTVDHELQNEMNRTRHILKMKKLMRIVKDPRAFERELARMEKLMNFRMRMSR